MSMFKMENTEGAPRIKTYAESDIRTASQELRIHLGHWYSYRICHRGYVRRVHGQKKASYSHR